MGGSVPEIPGHQATGNLLHMFRCEVADLLGRGSTAFPGAQPVSFASRHLKELENEDYFLCEKSDGLRCLMYLTEDEHGNETTYLIDRKNNYYHVPAGLHFPLVDSEADFHTRTIIDGELVYDKQPSGETQLNYLVFDCLVLDGDKLMHRTLDKRLAYYTERVDKPLRNLYKKYPEEIQHRPFDVILKKMEFAYGTEMMFRSILPSLKHGNDGLIFTSRTAPYKCGTDPHILKWKPEDENSIDFVLKLEWPLAALDSEDEEDGFHQPYRPDYSAKPTFCLEINCGDNRESQYAVMHVDDAEWEDLKMRNIPLDEQIVECVMDKEHRWRFLRFRNDKRDANHISTVESVIESIQDRISREELILAGKPIRDAWKQRQAQAEQGNRRVAATYTHDTKMDGA